MPKASEAVLRSACKRLKAAAVDERASFAKDKEELAVIRNAA